MTYQQTVLNDKPAGFWMITAASGTSETDLSGNSKTATITEATDLIDRGYRPLVTGTSTDRAFRFYSGNHKLTYPTLEMWEKQREHIPFSVEFTVQPIVSKRRVNLFAPQATTLGDTGDVMDNGIFLENGLLSFVVSNGSPTTYTTAKSVASTYLSTGQTYHVVAVYDVSKVYLYVDGALVSEETVNPSIKWSHTTANFITNAYSLSPDTLASSFLFDAVSVYRSALSPDQITKHYVMSTPNISDLEIVNGLGGKIIKLNDADRQKSLDFSAKEAGWTKAGNVVTDLVENEDGSLGLKKIEPVKLYNTVNNYNNMLTWNQATLEVDTTGWYQRDGSPTLARSTAQSASGLASLLVTATSTTGLVAVGTADVNGEPDPNFNQIPGSAGKTYTAVAKARAVSTTRTTKIYLLWYSASGFYIGAIAGTAISTTSGGWVDISVTATAPEGTAYVGVGPSIDNVTNGEGFYFDNIGLWEGTSTNWTPPPQQPFVSNAEISAQNYNRLDYPTANMLGINSAGWTGGGSTPLVNTAQLYGGTASIEYTSDAGGTLYPYSRMFTVTPGETLTASYYAKSGSVARNADVYWYFYTHAGAATTNYIGASTPTSTSAWTKISDSQVVPPLATQARIATRFASTLTGEKFYINSATVTNGTHSTFLDPVFNTDEINLTGSRYVRVDNAGSHLGKDVGGFGFFADFSATENDHAGEQALAALSSSDGKYILEVVKKTDKTLNLRYTYENQSGVITTTDTSWGAISSLLATNAYIYVEWGGGLATMYVNTTSSPAQVAFDAGTPAPSFDEKSFFHLGAGFDKNRPWNNFFKWLKLYNATQDTANFAYNKSTTNGFTAKLGSSLNVSQTGKALIEVPVPVDSTETIDQTRVTWEPVSNNVVVTTSVDKVENMLNIDQATVENLITFGQTPRGVGTTVAVESTLANVYRGRGALKATGGGAAGTVGMNFSASTAIVGYPGKKYSVSAWVRHTNATARDFYVFIAYNNSAGTYQSEHGASFLAVPPNTWTRLYASGTGAHANTAYVYAGVSANSLAGGEIVYVDDAMLVEGSDNTFGEPFQTATYGSEIVTKQFPTILPNNYYAIATLSTDDSYYQPTKLTDLKLEAFSNGLQYAENGWDQLVGSTADRVYSENLPQISQALYSGAFTNNQRNAFYVYPVDDTANVSIPDGGSAVSTAGSASLARTLEFWLYPEIQGYYVYHDGTTEYSMRYYDSGGFTTTGFTTLYVDGTVQANASTLSTWYGRWHHIVLTNASAQIPLNTDAPAGVNLLTANQASVETDMTGLIFGGGGSNAAVRTTAHSLHGGACVAVTTSSASPSGVYTGNVAGDRTSVTEGKTYTAVGWVKANTTPRNASIFLYFFNSGGSIIGSSYNGTSNPTNTNTWTRVNVTAVAPATAVKAAIVVYTSGGVAGEIHYMDCLGIWEGTSTKWALPGETTTKNLLSPNMASVETDATEHGAWQATVARTTTAGQFTYGTAGLAVTATTANACNVETTGSAPLLIPVVPGKTYTTHVDIRSAAVATATIAVGMFWRDINGNQVGNSTGTATTITTSWATKTHTWTAPAGAYSVQFLATIRGTFAISDVFYMDRFGIWEGTSTTWNMPDGRLWLGKVKQALNQSTARYQNISYYPQSFDATAVTNNYKAYLGDMTGSAPVDYSNMLSYDQATADNGVNTGMSVTFNPSTLTYTVSAATDQFYSGTHSHKIVYTSGTGVAQVNFGTPTGTAGFPVTPGTTYTAVARGRCTAARNFQVSIDWFNSANGYISSSSAGGNLVANTWENRTSTATAPATAAYATVTLVMINPVSGDSYWFDEVGLWHGSATTWVSPTQGGTRQISDIAPKFFSDVWEVQSTVTR